MTNESYLNMRIVTLLPSATEICALLGLKEHIVGISHECDYPHGLEHLPKLTSPKIDPSKSSEIIHQDVSRLVEQSLSVYQVDEEKLQELQPDLIITQDVCDVCAVSFQEVEAAVHKTLGNQAKIVSLSPLSFQDVLEDIERVASMTNRMEVFNEESEKLQNRLLDLTKKVSKFVPKRTVMVEWMHPPMIAGHWTPHLVKIAGGEPLLGKANSPTGPISLEKVIQCQADTVIVAPCGFKIEQSLHEIDRFLQQESMSRIPAVQNGEVYIIDGNAYFNRPGPRLVESAEILACALHPEIHKEFNYDNSHYIRYH
ncbi:MAG: cobalamin-binding protein [Spirochaetota bacterium]